MTKISCVLQLTHLIYFVLIFLVPDPRIMIPNSVGFYLYMTISNYQSGIHKCIERFKFLTGGKILLHYENT